MQCKHHSNRKAEQFCSSCGIPLCNDCAEEANPGEFFCFQCAMLQSVSAVGTSIKDKRTKSAEKKLADKEKKKWGPFQFFIIASSVVIVVMWGVIIFGGEKRPTGISQIEGNERMFLFMVNSSIKRYAHYKGDQYPDSLLSLIPRYLSLSKEDQVHLNKLTYEKDQKLGYRLFLTNPKEGDMIIIMTAAGIKHELPSGGV